MEVNLKTTSRVANSVMKTCSMMLFLHKIKLRDKSFEFNGQIEVSSA